MISVISQLSKKLQWTININNFFLRFYIAVWCILPTWWKTFSHQSHFWVHFCRRVWQCRTVCTDDDIIMMGNLFFCILMCIVMHASIFYTTIGNAQQKITCQKEWDVITQSLVYTLMQYILLHVCMSTQTRMWSVYIYSACLLTLVCKTYMLEAAADAGFDVGASEGGHLPQLPRDLDGFVKQQTELPLVTRVTCRCYLAEEVWAG